MSCTLCSTNQREAIEGVCPSCGSYPEDRAFAFVFRELARPAPQAKVLDVAPPPSQLAHLPSLLSEARYTAIAPLPLPEANHLRPPHRFLQMDITRLQFSDSSFDVIICNHVLSYVRSDFLAMSEVHRCLKSEGVAFLNASIRPGKSLRAGEGSGLPGSGREWRYGEDYFERLEAAGLFVLRTPLARLVGAAPEGLGLAPEAEQVFCFKFRHTLEKFAERLPA